MAVIYPIRKCGANVIDEDGPLILESRDKQRGVSRRGAGVAEKNTLGSPSSSRILPLCRKLTVVTCLKCEFESFALNLPVFRVAQSQAPLLLWPKHDEF